MTKPRFLSAVASTAAFFAATPFASAFVLATPVGPGSTFEGIMFRVEAAQTIEITAIQTMHKWVENPTLQIYYKPGSWEGYEEDAAGWEELVEGTVTAAGSGNLSSILEFETPVTLEAGQSGSFYLIPDSYYDLEYVSGDDDATYEDVTASDENLTIYGGASIDDPFGGHYFPGRVRHFLGAIHYEVAAIPEPSSTALLGAGAVGFLFLRRRRAAAQN